MNKYLIEQLDYFYRYAESISPSLGKDVVHHIATEIPQDLKHPKTYITTCIRNAIFNKESTFNKLYNPQDVFFDCEQIGLRKYDAMTLHKILLELEIEGYSLHVSVFKDCFLGTSISQVAQKTNTDRRYIKKICTFVQKEIQERYVDTEY